MNHSIEQIFGGLSGCRKLPFQLTHQAYQRFDLLNNSPLFCQGGKFKLQPQHVAPSNTWNGYASHQELEVIGCIHEN